MAGLPTVDPFNAAPVWFAPNPTPQILLHIAVAGSYLVSSGTGWVADISINTTAASGSLTVYDGIDATGTVMAVIDASKSSLGAGFSPWRFVNGLFVVLNGNADITIVAHQVANP
jgi:hypothetical protein